MVNIGHKRKRSVRAVKVQGVSILSDEQNESNKPMITTSRSQKCDKELSKEKIEDLRSMLKHMPLIDREYFKTLGI